jgi:hypothetical protein
MEEPENPAIASDVVSELAAERGLVRRLTRALGFADFMAVLMVAVTGFTAVATWRTASIAQAIYMASERAYFGVESVAIDNSRAQDPRVEIDFRNLGNVSAQEVKVTHRVLINGLAIKDQTKTINVGILSPNTPHHAHMHLPFNSYPAIVSGKTTLAVEIAASFAAGTRKLCYLERFAYVAHENDFLVDGGTVDCAAEGQVESEGAWALPKTTFSR